MVRFELELKEFADATEEQLNLALRKIGMDILRRVVEKTPVDTGRARAGWTIGINVTPTGNTDYEDKSGSATISDGEAAILKATMTDSIVLVNNVRYVVFLEEGSSTQAPHGMVAVTLQEFPNIVKRAAQ